MRLVLDTNILISALLKDSTVRRILLNPSFIFYLPEYSIEEVERHMDAIVRRSGLSEEDVRLLVRLLLTNIQVLPAEQLVEKCAEASRLLGGVDPGDTPSWRWRWQQLTTGYGVKTPTYGGSERSRSRGRET